MIEYQFELLFTVPASSDNLVRRPGFGQAWRPRKNGTAGRTAGPARSRQDSTTTRVADQPDGAMKGRGLKARGTRGC